MAVVIDFYSLTGELHKVSETQVDQEGPVRSSIHIC